MTELQECFPLRGEYVLWRRVRRKKYKPVPPHFGSRCFTPRIPKDQGKLSVNIAHLAEYAVAVEDANEYAIGAFQAVVARDAGLLSYHSPLPAEGSFPENPAHAHVSFLMPEDVDKWDVIAGILSRSAAPVVNPDTGRP